MPSSPIENIPVTSNPGSNQAATHLKSGLHWVGEHKWLFVAIGMLTTVIQFWRIGYLPQLTLGDLGLTAVATTLFTSVAICLLLLTVLTPGALFIAWTRAGLLPHAPSVRLRRHPLRSSAPKGAAPRARQGLATRALLPVLLYTYLAATIAALAWWAILFIFSKNHWDSWTTFPLLCSLVGTFFGVSIEPARDGQTRRRRQRCRRLKFFLLSLSLYSLGAFPVFMVYFALNNGLSEEDGSWRLLLVALVPALHFCIYAVQRHALYIKAMFLGAMCLYIVIFTGIFFDASDMAAAKFRLGMMKNQVVLVTPLGCETARLSGVVTSCGITTGSAGSLACLENVQILTRVGAHIVVAGPKWKSGEPTASVAIPVSEVRAWYRVPPLDPYDDLAAGTATPNPACSFPPKASSSASPGT